MSQTETSSLVNSYAAITMAGVEFDEAVLTVWNDHAEEAESEEALVAMILTPILSAIKNGETFQQARSGQLSFEPFYLAFMDLTSSSKEYKTGARRAYFAVYGEKLNSGRLITSDERAAKSDKTRAAATPKASLDAVMEAMRSAGCSEEQVKNVMLSLAA